MGLTQRAVVFAVEQHVLGRREVGGAEQVAERRHDGVFAAVDDHVACALGKLEELLGALVVAVVVFLPAALIQCVAADERGCDVAVDGTAAVALADIVKRVGEVLVHAVHHLVARCTVFVDLVAVEIGNLVVVVRHVAEDIDQTGVLNAVEEAGKAHPVVVGLGGEYTFHALLEAVLHDVDLADVGKVPRRTLVLALVVAGAGRCAALSERHLTREVGLRGIAKHIVAEAGIVDARCVVNRPSCTVAGEEVVVEVIGINTHLVLIIPIVVILLCGL